VIDALPQRLDFDLERLDRAPRQRFGQRAADVGEIGAQGLDRRLEFACRPQRLDARRDLPQLPVEATRSGAAPAVVSGAVGELSRSEARPSPGCAKGAGGCCRSAGSRSPGAAPSSARCRAMISATA
jgi:hypothetical protein